MPNIPKLIHYIWVGGKPIPKRFQKNIESWVKHNPEYELRLWNEDNIVFSNDLLKAAYDQRKWSMVSDFVRLAVVKEFGGIYLDTDVFAVKPFAPLLDCGCFLGMQQDLYVNCAVLGAEPNHWLVTRAYQHYVNLENAANNAVVDYSSAFGPDVLTQILKDEQILKSTDDILSAKNVTIFPRRFFYPYNWDEEFSENCITPDTVAIHFWELSWHLDEKSWLRRKVTSFLKSYPSLFKSLKRIAKRFRPLNAK